MVLSAEALTTCRASGGEKTRGTAGRGVLCPGPGPPGGGEGEVRGGEGEGGDGQKQHPAHAPGDQQRTAPAAAAVPRPAVSLLAPRGRRVFLLPPPPCGGAARD